MCCSHSKLKQMLSYASSRDLKKPHNNLICFTDILEDKTIKGKGSIQSLSWCNRGSEVCSPWVKIENLEARNWIKSLLKHMPYSVRLQQFWHICPSVCEPKRLVWNYLPWREGEHKMKKRWEKFSLQQLPFLLVGTPNKLQVARLNNIDPKFMQLCATFDCMQIILLSWRERGEKKQLEFWMPRIKIFNAWEETW